MRALIFGASGGLATCLAQSFLDRNWHVDLVTRGVHQDEVTNRFERAISESTVRVFSVEDRYSNFVPSGSYQSYFFTQSLFDPRPLTAMDEASIAREVEVGLLDIVQLVRKLLATDSHSPQERRDYGFIGSTSSYAGFRNTSVYCAVKHGLLGFVRALNDEYAATDTRFWLFSMGTMDTVMGRRLVDQDATSFLQPSDVAQRIVDAICSPSTIFEPEVILRRRTIRFKGK